jgi:zinc transport system ATP-binding protein
MSDHDAITLERVRFSYNGRVVLEDVDLTVAANEFVWMVGPNGGGKTTLLKLVLGLLTPDSGRVRVFGRSPRTARGHIGYMPQQLSLDPQFPISVMDVVLMGRLGRGGGRGGYAAVDRKAATQALEQVGLADRANELFSELSGGQQRRMFVARALACEPELLILDEPTANVDQLLQRELYNLLEILKGKTTVVMVSHDPAFVGRFVRQVVCVNRTVDVHPTGEVSSERLGEWYRGRDVRIVHHDRHYPNGENHG